MQPSCDICELRKIVKNASIWCSECDQYLCTECTEFHSISKSSEKHFTQNVKDYLNLPEFLRALRNRCDAHSWKYEFLCPTHDELCCLQCLQNKHKECDQLTPLPSIISDIRKSSIVKELEVTLKELELNFKCMIKECEDTIETLKSTMDTCRTEVQELRLTMEAHLRKIEKKMMDEFTSKYHKCLDMKESYLNKCKLAAEKVAKTYCSFESMKEHASEMQIFLGIREIDSFIKDDRHLMDTLLHDEAFTVSKCKLDISPAPFYITSDQTLLGQLYMTDVQVNFTPGTLRGKEAQIVRPTGHTIHQYGLKRYLQLFIPDGKQSLRMTGCTIAKTGEIIMTDKANQRLLIFEKNGTFRKEINFYGSPVDVVPIRQNIVATTLADKSKIKFVNTETGSTCHKVLIPGPGYGVSICNDNETEKIVTRIRDYGFMILETSGKNSHLVKVPGDCILYVTYKADKFYFTKWDTNKVLCCDKTGKIIWEFENEALKKPCGVALTNEGNVIVAGFESNNIIIISRDGMTFKELYKNYEQLNNPTAVSFHSEDDFGLLVVTNLNDGLCNVFEVTIEK